MKKFGLMSAVTVLAVTAALPAQGQWANSPSVSGAIYYNGGRVGIGTNAPQSLLHLSGPGGVSNLTFDSPGVQKFRFGTLPGIVNWGGLTINSSYNGSGWVLDDTGTNGWFLKVDGRGGNTGNENNGLWLFRIPSGAYTHTDEAPVFGITNGRAWFSGKVGVGTPSGLDPTTQLYVAGTGRITGDLTVDGNIAAKYQDVAEWVPATEELSSGMVVVIDPNTDNSVAASAKAYQTSVAGVISPQPGLLLGEGGASKEKVATTGRVKVLVDATRGAIMPGDLLVTSDIRGTAMKSEMIDIGGVKIHRPGTIVGKALEPLPSGKGEILVLLSLQ
jgi:hypothetical protein